MRKFICDPNSAYHVSTRCINRDWFAMPMDEVWKITSTNLNFVSYAYALKIHAFVLMNNHFHILVSSPNANLSLAMNYFLSMTSRQITHDADRINQTFARRFKRSRIDSIHYFLNCYKYIYQNPVRAGLCDRVENYPYSTIRGSMGLGPLDLPVYDDTLMNDIEGTITWLNRPISEAHIDAVRKALRKDVFKYPSTKSRVAIIPPETLI